MSRENDLETEKRLEVQRAKRDWSTAKIRKCMRLIWKDGGVQIIQAQWAP